MLEKVESTPNIEIAIDETVKANILSHSCQLFEEGGDYVYSPFGSGVLACISEKYFLLTVAHVTEELNIGRTLFIKGDGRFIPIVGVVRETDFATHGHPDLAYIILDASIIDSIKAMYQFLPITKIRGRHKLLDAAQYCVLGFPAKNIKLEKGKVRTGAAYYMVQPSKEKVYDHYKFDNSFILFDFKGRGIDMLTREKSDKIDDPKGISGCGIWLVMPKAQERELIISYFLVGLIIGGKKGKYHMLYGNKIDILLDAMNKFGDIRIQYKK